MTRLMLMLTLALGVALTPLSAVADSKADKERAEIRKTATETLSLLYKTNPSLKASIGKAAGYAAFSNLSVKIFTAGGGTGKGLAVNNRSKKETFMRMAEVQAGLGVGVKTFRIVFVFETDQALNNFIEQGWEFGGQATAAATTGSEGAGLQGAVSVSPGVWMFQLTDQGIAAEVTGKGTKYWKDDALN